jgi:hypothetical protein
MALSGSCHCGAVQLAVATAPETLTSCNCSICRRLGTLWAYYTPADVTITGTTATYCWGDKTLDLHHCPTCACITHWFPKPHIDQNRMGINVRLLAPEIVETTRIRRLDGASDDWKYLDD